MFFIALPVTMYQSARNSDDCDTTICQMIHFSPADVGSWLWCERHSISFSISMLQVLSTCTAMVVPRSSRTVSNMYATTTLNHNEFQLIGGATPVCV